MNTLDSHALDLLFHEARSQNGWRDEPVTEEQLRRLYEIMQWGPTSMNCQPLRILFLRSPEAKERLQPALMPNNVAKTMSAPVVAILGYDTKFYENLPRTFPHNQKAKSLFEDKPDFADTTAFRNSSIQGGYFIIAARAVGLDAGPMSGFANPKVDAEFWPDGRVKSNFLCGLGQGDPEKVFNRSPRLAFDEVCTLV
ncbi:malonic semialdehyde reductase (plasmid) [Skermanella rosea]|uniref:malonic semialdehyde reductase n=1 Tax=Skermanella rosea TaxID=1817965 RepID=UPI001934574C|nr:malonic semialdehyde reductase [Skermanella rosea]UEM07283.1 malonic semialdehyde reductase [Skermanella rosea]